MTEPLSTPVIPPGDLPDELWPDDLRRVGQTPLAWLWHGYLKPGAVTLLTSRWKSGKTTLLSVLLSRLASGGELAGRAVAPGKAVVVSEESPEQWASRGRQLDFGRHVCWLSLSRPRPAALGRSLRLGFAAPPPPKEEARGTGAGDVTRPFTPKGFDNPAQGCRLVGNPGIWESTNPLTLKGLDRRLTETSLQPLRGWLQGGRGCTQGGASLALGWVIHALSGRPRKNRRSLEPTRFRFRKVGFRRGLPCIASPLPVWSV